MDAQQAADAAANADDNRPLVPALVSLQQDGILSTSLSKWQSLTSAEYQKGVSGRLPIEILGYGCWWVFRPTDAGSNFSGVVLRCLTCSTTIWIPYEDADQEEFALGKFVVKFAPFSSKSLEPTVSSSLHEQGCEYHSDGIPHSMTSLGRNVPLLVALPDVLDTTQPISKRATINFNAVKDLLYMTSAECLCRPTPAFEMLLKCFRGACVNNYFHGDERPLGAIMVAASGLKKATLQTRSKLIGLPLGVHQTNQQVHANTNLDDQLHGLVLAAAMVLFENGIVSLRISIIIFTHIYTGRANDIVPASL